VAKTNTCVLYRPTQYEHLKFGLVALPDIDFRGMEAAHSCFRSQKFAAKISDRKNRIVIFKNQRYGI
jgi:hypothetical protein